MTLKSLCYPMIWFAYSLFLANTSITCEQFIIGTLCYLSNWNIWYSRMKMNLALSCKELRIYFANIKNSNSMLLNDIQIPTRVISSYTCLNLLHMLLAIAMSFVKSCWPLLRKLSCPQDQDNVHPHRHVVPTLGVRKNMLPFRSTKNSAPTLEVDKKHVR